MTRDSSGRSLTYSVFDKPLTIQKGSHTTRFSYGPSRARFKRVDEGANGTTTTLYAGSVEKIYYADNTIEWKRNIAGVGVFTEKVSSGGVRESLTKHYLHFDHLGSLSLISDASGGSFEEHYFDPWGDSRKPDQPTDKWLDAKPFEKLSKPVTSRGYTGHEMLDELELIHMNGRIYDAKIARFVQADPIIQDPLKVQSLNRYSYVWNNPLNATDPSGFQAEAEWSFINNCGVVQACVPALPDPPAPELPRENGSGGDSDSGSQGNGVVDEWLAEDLLDQISNNSFGSGAGAGQSAGSNNFIPAQQVNNQGLSSGEALRAMGGVIADHWKTILRDTISMTRDENIIADKLVDFAGAEAAVEGVISAAEGDVSQAAMSAAEVGLSKIKLIRSIGSVAGSSGATQEMIRGSFSILVKDGAIDLTMLQSYIPENLNSNFGPSDRVPAGQKYRFKIGGTKVQIKWHSPDLMLRNSRLHSSNSARVWTAQIKVGNKFLMTNGEWTRKQKSNRTHIPVIRKK